MKKIIIMGLCLSFSSSWAYPIHGLLPTSQILKKQSKIDANFTPSEDAELVAAGGYGGNARTGLLTYSGPPNLPTFIVSREPKLSVCFFQTPNATVIDYNAKVIIGFKCSYPDANHNNLYWDADLGEVNGGYSPENDTLFAVDIVINMFKDWYKILPLTDKSGSQIPIKIYLHEKIDNALLANDGFSLGDGGSNYYPLTSLDVIGYMIGNIFTEQHSKLEWTNAQSGGISTAFDCMTAMAAENYLTGRNTWQVGKNVSKNGEALHYLDQPSKSCHANQKPGDYCDVDTLAQYNERPNMLPYFSSGLFNRAFYNLATTNGWNTQKAYKVFLRANLKYWKSNTDFHSGACDVLFSAEDLGYDKMSVMRAFSRVGIDTRDCKRV